MNHSTDEELAFVAGEVPMTEAAKIASAVCMVSRTSIDILFFKPFKELPNIG